MRKRKRYVSSSDESSPVVKAEESDSTYNPSLDTSSRPRHKRSKTARFKASTTAQPVRDTKEPPRVKIVGTYNGQNLINPGPTKEVDGKQRRRQTCKKCHLLRGQGHNPCKGDGSCRGHDKVKADGSFICMRPWDHFDLDERHYRTIFSNAAVLADDSGAGVERTLVDQGLSLLALDSEQDRLLDALRKNGETFVDVIPKGRKKPTLPPKVMREVSVFIELFSLSYFKSWMKKRGKKAPQTETRKARVYDAWRTSQMMGVEKAVALGHQLKKSGKFKMDNAWSYCVHYDEARGVPVLGSAAAPFFSHDEQLSKSEVDGMMEAYDLGAPSSTPAVVSMNKPVGSRGKGKGKALMSSPTVQPLPDSVKTLDDDLSMDSELSSNHGSDGSSGFTSSSDDDADGDAAAFEELGDVNADNLLAPVGQQKLVSKKKKKKKVQRALFRDVPGAQPHEPRPTVERPITYLDVRGLYDFDFALSVESFTLHNNFEELENRPQDEHHKLTIKSRTDFDAWLFEQDGHDFLHLYIPPRDGHCGFRALCYLAGLGTSDKAVRLMRSLLAAQLKSQLDTYASWVSQSGQKTDLHTLYRYYGVVARVETMLMSMAVDTENPPASGVLVSQPRYWAQHFHSQLFVDCFQVNYFGFNVATNSKKHFVTKTFSLSPLPEARSVLNIRKEDNPLRRTSIGVLQTIDLWMAIRRSDHDLAMNRDLPLEKPVEPVAIESLDNGDDDDDDDDDPDSPPVGFAEAPPEVKQAPPQHLENGIQGPRRSSRARKAKLIPDM